MGAFGFLEFENARVSLRFEPLQNRGEEGEVCKGMRANNQDADDAIRDFGGRPFMGSESAQSSMTAKRKLIIQYHPGAPSRNPPKGCL